MKATFTTEKSVSTNLQVVMSWKTWFFTSTAVLTSDLVRCASLVYRTNLRDEIRAGLTLKTLVFWNVISYSLAARFRLSEDPAAFVFVVGEGCMLIISSHTTRRHIPKDDVSVSAVSEFLR